MQMKKHARDQKKNKKEKERSSLITKHKLKMFSDNSSTRKKIINQNVLPNQPFVDPSLSGSGHNLINQQQYRSQAPRLYQPAPQYRISRESFSVKKQYEQNSPGFVGIPAPVPNIQNVVLKNNHMPRHSRTYKLKRADRYVNETEVNYEVQIENAPSSKRGSKPIKRGDVNTYKSGISSSSGAPKSSTYHNNNKNNSSHSNYPVSRPPISTNIQGLADEEDYENVGWKRERYESQLSQETTELAEKSRRIPFSSNSIPTSDPRYDNNSRRSTNTTNGNNNNNNNNTARTIGRPQSPTTFGRGNFSDNQRNPTHNAPSLQLGTSTPQPTTQQPNYPSYNPGNYLNAPLPYSPSPLDLQQQQQQQQHSVNPGFSVSQQPPPPHFGFSSHHQPPPPLPQNNGFPIDPHINHHNNSNSHSQNYQNSRNQPPSIPPYTYNNQNNQPSSFPSSSSSRRGGHPQQPYQANGNSFQASSASRQPYNRFVYNVEIENALESKQFMEKYETSMKTRQHHHRRRQCEDKLDLLDSPTAGISSRSNKHSTFYSESDERLTQLNEILRHSNRDDPKYYNNNNYYYNSDRRGAGKHDQHYDNSNYYSSILNDNDSDTISYPELVENVGGVGISNIHTSGNNNNHNTKFPYDIVNAGHYDYSKDLEQEQIAENTTQNNVARKDDMLNTHTKDEKYQLLDKLNELAILQQQQQNTTATQSENKEEEKKEIDSFGDRKMDNKNDTIKQNENNSSTIRKKKNPYNLSSKKRHEYYEQCLTTGLLDKTIVHPVQPSLSSNENNNNNNKNNTNNATTNNKHNEVEYNSIVIRKHKYKKGKENNNNNDERRPSPLPDQFQHFDYSKTKSSTNNNSTSTYKIKPSTRYLNM